MPAKSMGVRRRNIACACHEASPPISGVPVPGAKAGSSASTSKVRYAGATPTISTTRAAMAAGPASCTSCAEMIVMPCSIVQSHTSRCTGLRMPICTLRLGSISPSRIACQNGEP